ncbi:Serine protease [Phytophthora megakarya]|uniref:Serine protease n=1 Tax=Phytophthora megakarya TaxID=4795 RepID=A0A225VLS9_9STRA|nr:Serine protease [Phytophthora megakarya]
MKSFFSVATAIIAIISFATSALGSSSGSSSVAGSGVGDTPDVVIDTVNTTDVPIGEKAYVTGLRWEEDGPNRCFGALISPTHVLTTSSCITRHVRWASIGSHYYNGTQDGERIRIVAHLMQPRNAKLSGNFMVLELEKPSSIKPVILASDDSAFKVGDWIDVLGWKFIRGSATRVHELQSARVRIMRNEECATMLQGIDETMVCTGGLANEDPCHGANGGPVIVPSSSGQDVLVGIVSWGINCFQPNIPSVTERISSGRAWIDRVIAGTCVA